MIDDLMQEILLTYLLSTIEQVRSSYAHQLVDQPQMLLGSKTMKGSVLYLMKVFMNTHKLS